jgi:hypothetical protein
MLLRHSFIVVYTTAFILMIQSLLHTHHSYICTWRNSPCSPCQLPFASLSCPLPLTWHPPVVIGIVHLPLRFLVNGPHLLPFTQLTHPSQIPGTPPALRLTTTTSGIFWLLVSRTCTYIKMFLPFRAILGTGYFRSSQQVLKRAKQFFG